MPAQYTALLIIPTGIGARIGGFAGDALPIVRTLASCVGRVITHPNVLNGASLFWPLPNVLYVEGYGLDGFCRGRYDLRLARQNRVGVLLDAAIEPDLLLRQIQVIQAAQATLGLDIGSWATTDAPLGIAVSTGPSGASHGSLLCPEAVLAGARRLQGQGAEAIALVARFPDDLDFVDYDQGRGVDPLAGMEALLSHLLVRELGIPCAHAPALRAADPPLPVHARAAAEEIGFTFLPSVLAGLSYAPRLVAPGLGDLSAAAVDVVLTPATACGGPGVLALMDRPDPPLLVVVAENTSTMRAHPQDLGLPHLQVGSYLEAIGLVVAHRAGVSLKALLGT